MAEPALKEVNALDASIKKALSELALGESIIQGKVQEVSQPQNGDYNYFVIGGKATDEYSLPPVMQVSQPNNQRPFAQTGDVVTVHVKNGGYPRKVNGNTYYSNTFTFLGRID